MFHVPFQHQRELLNDNNTSTAAYATFLESGNIPTLEDDVHHLEPLSQQPSGNDGTEVCSVHDI